MQPPNNSACSDWLDLIQQVSETPPNPSPLPQPRVTLANPPYGKINIGYMDITPYDLAYSWKKQGETFVRTKQVKSTVAGEVIFSELCIRELKPNEVAVMLVPNGLLSADGMMYARKWIVSKCQLLASIQLPPEAWKAECGLGLKTSLLVLRRKLDDEPDLDYKIFITMVKKVGYDSRHNRLYIRNEQGNRTEQVDDNLPKIEQEFKQFMEQHD